MKLKLLRLKARSLGLDSSGTREEVEARILETEKQNSCQTQNQPQFNLSEDSDMSISEEGPNLLPQMMERLNENPETKSRISAFERIKRDRISAFARLKRPGESSSISKRKHVMPQSEFFVVSSSDTVKEIDLLSYSIRSLLHRVWSKVI